MTENEIRQGLKNMSGDELARAQNAIVVASDLHPAEQCAALELISQEVTTRQSEGIGRKAGRFWNRHGERVGMLAIGALIGDWVGD